MASKQVVYLVVKEFRRSNFPTWRPWHIMSAWKRHVDAVDERDRLRELQKEFIKGMAKENAEVYSNVRYNIKMQEVWTSWVPLEKR